MSTMTRTFRVQEPVSDLGEQLRTTVWNEFRRVRWGGIMRHESERTVGQHHLWHGQRGSTAGGGAVDPLLGRQFSEALRARQRFAQRHEMILHGSPLERGRQGLLDLLAGYTALMDQLDSQRDDLVVLARQQGVSWAQIAIMLGISRQAAQQGYQAACDRAARRSEAQEPTGSA